MQGTDLLTFEEPGTEIVAELTKAGMSPGRICTDLCALYIDLVKDELIWDDPKSAKLTHLRCSAMNGILGIMVGLAKVKVTKVDLSQHTGADLDLMAQRLGYARIRPVDGDSTPAGGNLAQLPAPRDGSAEPTGVPPEQPAD